MYPLYDPADTDANTVGDFTVALHYDDCAENPQHAYDHAAVIVPFGRRSYWQRSTLADQVPDSVVGADKLTRELANLDPDRFADDYVDDGDGPVPTGYLNWCTAMRMTFGADVHVAFVAYEDYGSSGCRVRAADDPLPLADLEATWQAIVDPDSGWTADGCIAVSAHTAPGTDIDAYADIVRGELAELTAYLSGDCYYWTVTDTTTGEIVQSCGGYYDADHAYNAARDEAEWCMAHRTATLAWLRAEADWRTTVPDVTVMLAAQRTLWALDELAQPVSV